MNKEIVIRLKAKTLLIVTALIAAVIITVAAVSTTIQATLDPGITIRYNNQVQNMTDANGNPVFPVMYQGTTYLPVRAVSNMLGVDVDWDGDTRTVLLGQNNASQPVNQPTEIELRTSGLPRIGREHSSGYKLPDIAGDETASLQLRFDRVISSIEFYPYVGNITDGGGTLYEVILTNTDTGAILSRYDYRWYDYIDDSNFFSHWIGTSAGVRNVTITIHSMDDLPMQNIWVFDVD